MSTIDKPSKPDWPEVEKLLVEIRLKVEKADLREWQKEDIAELRKWPDIRLAELAEKHQSDREDEHAADVGEAWLAEWHAKEHYFVSLGHQCLSLNSEHFKAFGEKHPGLLDYGISALDEASDIRFIILRALSVEPRELLPPYLQREQPPIVRHGLRQLFEARIARSAIMEIGGVGPGRPSPRKKERDYGRDR